MAANPDGNMTTVTVAPEDLPFLRTAQAQSGPLLEYMENALVVGNVKESARVRRYRGTKRSQAAVNCLNCCVPSRDRGPDTFDTSTLRVGVLFFDRQNPQRMPQTALFWLREQEMFVLIDLILDADTQGLFTLDHIASMISATQPLWGASVVQSEHHGAAEFRRSYRLKWSMSEGSVAKFIELLGSTTPLRQLMIEHHMEPQLLQMFMRSPNANVNAPPQAAAAQPTSAQPMPTMDMMAAPPPAFVGTCAHCSAALTSDQKFCSSCGTPVTPEIQLQKE